MFQHVVVAAHFGSAAPALLRSIQQLKKQGTREFTLVDVLRSHDPESGDEAQRQAVQRRLEETRDRLKDEQTTVHVELRIGQPAHELSTLARAREADLIVLGSRGESAFREFLRGSTVLQLARKTTTPLLIEPVDTEGASVTDFSSLLLATDFSDSATAAEDMALRLAPAASHVIFAHVVDHDAVEDEGEAEATRHAEERLAALAGRVSGGDATIDKRLGRGTPSQQIRQLADDSNTGLIIIGKRGNSPVRELMLGSTTAAMVRRTTRPLLIVPTPRRGI